MNKKIISNHLKAVLFSGEVQDEGQNVLKEKCCTLDYFSYRCERSRNDAGFPYGVTNPSVLSFTVRLVVPEEGTVYHQRLLENVPNDYTFLFNASFNDQQRLKSCDNMFIVNGYVIDVEDDFTAGSKESRQMLIRVKLFVNSITYKGKMMDRQLVINSMAE
jgi:hypothetical protein